MPTKNRVWRDDGGQFHQGLSAQGLAFHGQESVLVIGQQKPFLSLYLHHSLKFRLVELDRLLLFAADPGGQDHEEKLPRLQDVAHGSPFGEAIDLHLVACLPLVKKGRPPKSGSWAKRKP